MDSSANTPRVQYPEQVQVPNLCNDSIHKAQMSLQSSSSHMDPIDIENKDVDISEDEHSNEDLADADDNYPRVISRLWTEEDDLRLIKAVNENGLRNWSYIASLFPGRRGKQCRDRWVNQLQPNIKRGDWTQEEEAILVEGHKKYGTRWSSLGKLLPGRPENAIKNHWNAVLRCKMKRNAHGKTLRSGVLRAYQQGLSKSGKLQNKPSKRCPSKVVSDKTKESNFSASPQTFASVPSHNFFNQGHLQRPPDRLSTTDGSMEKFSCSSEEILRLEYGRGSDERPACSYPYASVQEVQPQQTVSHTRTHVYPSETKPLIPPPSGDTSLSALDTVQYENSMPTKSAESGDNGLRRSSSTSQSLEWISKWASVNRSADHNRRAESLEAEPSEPVVLQEMRNGWMFPPTDAEEQVLPLPYCGDQPQTSGESIGNQAQPSLDGVFITQEPLDATNTFVHMSAAHGSEVVCYTSLAKSSTDKLNIDPANHTDCSYVGVSLREMLYGVRLEIPLTQVYIALRIGPLETGEIKFFVMVSSSIRQQAASALSILSDAINELCT